MQTKLPVDDEALICPECAGSDPYLAEQFANEGDEGACSLCDQGRVVVPLWALSDIVHELFRKYARRADDSFEIDGDRAYSVDGGTPAASLAATGTDAGPVSFSAAICSCYDDAGVATVYLALPSIVRGSSLGAGGTFSFGTTSIVQGTACGCDIYVAETISGSLTGTTDAGVSLNADGGLPTLLGFSGTVVDQISDNNADAGATCSCNLPCDLQYTMSAVPIAP